MGIIGRNTESTAAGARVVIRARKIIFRKSEWLGVRLPSSAAASLHPELGPGNSPCFLTAVRRQPPPLYPGRRADSALIINHVRRAGI